MFMKQARLKQDNKCSWNTSSKIINVHETLQAR